MVSCASPSCLEQTPAYHHHPCTGTDYDGGYLCGVTNTSCATGDWRQSYANKIVKYIQDYNANGIEIAYVDPWNEPDLK